jgi:hypothetical protein
LVGWYPQRPDDAVVGPGADLDLVRTRLAPDLRAPGVDVLDVVQVVDHLVACKQLSVVVLAADTRDEAVDASPDVNGIVHDLRHEMMTPDVRRGTRICPSEGH